MKRGFTLLETITVIIIIGIIVGFLIPDVYIYIEDAKVNKFKEDGRTIIKAVEMHMEDNDMLTLPNEGFDISNISSEVDGKWKYAGVAVMYNGEVVIETMSNGKLCGYGSKSKFYVDKVGGKCHKSQE